MFKTFSEAVHKRYEDMAKHELFTVDTLNIYETYLASFPEGTNPIFRERTEHDCNCCKQFIRRLGCVVAIVDGIKQTVWDVADMPYPYDVIATRLGDLVRQAPITGVFRTKEGAYGQEFNFDNHTNQRWNHFHGVVSTRHRKDKPAEEIGKRNATAQVMRRGLTELTASALDTVIDMIEHKAVYRGEEFLGAVKGFRELFNAYQAADDKELFIWSNLDNRAALFKNSAIGTFVEDVSAGMDEEKAAEVFGKKLDPTRYKRPTSAITPKMIDAAVNTLKELDLEQAIERRFAKISDVSVNNVLFVDNSVKGNMRDGIAGLLMEAVKPQTVDIKHAEDISGEDFFATILPQAGSIELLVQNKHVGNFVSITAPVHESTGRLFKWDNDFAWSYDGEVADSIKQRVKAAGGNVDAALRVSLAWWNNDDLDLHCECPDGHVYYSNKMGILDIDMNGGGGMSKDRRPVENLAWKNPRNGTYKVYVNQYCRRETIDTGFAIEFAGFGKNEQFTFDRAVNGSVACFSFTLKNGNLTDFIVSPNLIGGSVSTDKWGIKTETLVPVDTIMASPNHWDSNATGNKHWFFLLKGCKNPDSVRGIYNEFLRADLEKHRKVFEVLGSKAKCPPSDQQLSGVGFSSTRGDSVIAVVKGAKINRAFNIQF